MVTNRSINLIRKYSKKGTGLGPKTVENMLNRQICFNVIQRNKWNKTNALHLLCFLPAYKKRACLKEHILTPS